jgi:hypothetical protein
MANREEESTSDGPETCPKTMPNKNHFWFPTFSQGEGLIRSFDIIIIILILRVELRKLVYTREPLKVSTKSKLTVIQYG